MNERRRFLQVLGGGAVAVGAGCTGSVSSSGGTGGNGGGGTGGSTAAGQGGCGSGGASTSGTNADLCHSDAGVFAVGKPADYAQPGLYKVAALASNVLIGHDAGGLYALSSLCTHLCCDLNSMQQGFAIGTLTTNAGTPIIRCNCHGSEFAYDGSLVKGPASLSLAPYDLRLGCDGILYADTTKVVNRNQRLMG